MYLGRYDVIELPRGGELHWILNPGIAINELVLGQRIAARTLVDQTSDAPWFNRVYLECRNCGEIHKSMLWRKSPMGNWFGIVCPACEAKIPTLLNIFSRVLLIPTAPVWFPLKLVLEKPLHRRQLARIRNTPEISTSTTGMSLRSALIMGGAWAALMYLFFTQLMPVLMRGISITMIPLTPLHHVLAALMCAAGGMLLGLYTRWVTNRRVKSISGKGV